MSETESDGEKPQEGLDELQQRIQRLKAENEPKKEAPLASIHLAFSLGVTVLGSLFLGDYFGRMLVEHAGNEHLRLVGWGLGLALAGLSGYKLLKPYLG